MHADSGGLFEILVAFCYVVASMSRVLYVHTLLRLEVWSLLEGHPPVYARTIIPVFIPSYQVRTTGLFSYKTWSRECLLVCDVVKGRA